MPLYKFILKLRPYIINLMETMADASSTINKIWPGSQCTQILTRRGNASPAREGVAIAFRPGPSSSLVSRNDQASDNRNGLIQTVKVRVAATVTLVGIYASSQAGSSSLT